MTGKNVTIDGEKTGFSFVLVGLYTLLSISYFLVFDKGFYIKNVLIDGINIAIPLPYILLIVGFTSFYSSVLKQKPKVVFSSIMAMALILGLLYLLTDLRIGMRSVNPFSGNRNIYGIYAEVYYFICMTIFSFFCGMSFRKLKKGEGAHFLTFHNIKAQNMIFHMPIFIYFILIETMLLANGFLLYSSVFLLLFFVALIFDSTDGISRSIKLIFSRVTNDQRLFLLGLFLLAFVIRYFWGMRLLGITGERFTMASDDGRAYDPIAATLAQGGVLSRESAFNLMGFAYWYFLAAIYKIFGLHNFKTMVTIQSILGSTVPLFTYLMAKRLFKLNAVSSIASLIACFNMNLVFLSVVIGMEALYIPLFLLAATVAVYFLTEAGFNYKRAFVLGGLFGLANNARGELLFAPFILAFVVGIFIRNRGKIMNVALLIMFIFLGFVLSASIQHVTNYTIYGEYAITQRAAKTNFADSRFTDENAILDKMGFNPFKSISHSFNTLLEKPALVATLLAKGFLKRSVIYYLQPNFGVFDPIFLVNTASGYFFRFPVFLQLCGSVFILYGILSSFLKRENIGAIVLLLSFTFYISSIYIFVLLQNPRNRGVLVPIACLFVAYGIATFYQRVRSIYKDSRNN